jgi:hypothetical protein
MQSTLTPAPLSSIPEIRSSKNDLRCYAKLNGMVASYQALPARTALRMVLATVWDQRPFRKMFIRQLTLAPSGHLVLRELDSKVSVASDATGTETENVIVIVTEMTDCLTEIEEVQLLHRSLFHRLHAQRTTQFRSHLLMLAIT